MKVMKQENIEDRRISFETAKLAINVLEKFKINHLNYMVDGNNPGSVGSCISCTSYIKCPTQNQVRKILKKLYDIDIEIRTYENDKKISYDYIIYDSNIDLINYMDGPWDDYEDCLEGALNRVLSNKNNYSILK